MIDEEGSIFSEDQWERITEAMRVSPRQMEIVRCLFRGFGDKQIARHLGISVHTVRTHFDRLFLRCGAADRIELILRVVTEFLNQCASADCPRMGGPRSQ